MATHSAQTHPALVRTWQQNPVAASLISGVVASISGLAGGLVMGMIMLMMMPALVPQIGALLGVPDLGLLVHMLFSALIGAGFGLTLARLVRGWGSAISWGLFYGAVWWVLGPLLIMPIWMGMGPMLGSAFEMDMLMSLGGHLVFGLVLGIVYRWLIATSAVENAAAKASSRRA